MTKIAETGWEQKVSTATLKRESDCCKNGVQSCGHHSKFVLRIVRIIRMTDRAVLFELAANKVRHMKVKRGTELWIPQKALNGKNVDGEKVYVSEIFWNQLVFVQ